ncbi:regulatory protein [Sporomusaceae bacterium BoRhaA]|uniref:regulatory protein RecX n=1 Tax=Pelorhabdus rhamnosifermentans TaxID=2772457 RepID=UPI001C063733|nr:RecX family transcriptional regulator [Pelorhabdus rhamnosifermentans]MBU2701924.1 regulatory protein [Pelorhabdus rhamnosifermentans]
MKSKPEMSAYSYGLRLLSFRGYSEAALIEKLSHAHYLEPEIESAIEKLKSYGFINDQELARAYFNKYVTSDKMGFYLIRAKLKQKKFTSEVVEECLSHYNHDEAFHQAFNLAKRHFSAAALQDKAKIIRYLTYRGFSSEVVQKTLTALNLTLI